MSNKSAAAASVPAVHKESGLPAEMMDSMMADAGMGVSTDPNEVGIPFLYILQDLSPQVKKRDEAYIDGAEVGDIYNHISKEVIPAAVGFDWIEVGFEPAQVEWKPDRGGFVAKHPHNTPLLQQVKQVDNGQGRMIPTLPSGNTLTETKYHYGLYRRSATADAPAGQWEAAVIGMASSMIKNSRELEGMKKRLRLPNGANAPAFAVYYSFKTLLVNKNNNDWFVWKIAMQTNGEQPRWVTSEEYRVSRELALQVAAGTVKTAAPDGGEQTGSEIPDEEVI